VRKDDRDKIKAKKNSKRDGKIDIDEGNGG